MPGRVAGVALLLLLVIPAAAAHHAERAALGPGQLLDGSIVPMAGDVAVAAFAEGSLCTAAGAAVVDFGGGMSATLVHNATHVGALVRGSGWWAFLPEAGGSVRSLIAMQERAVVLHDAVAATGPGDQRTGVAGIPVDLGEPAHPHFVGAYEPQTGLSLSYDEVPAASPCGPGGPILLAIGKEHLLLAGDRRVVHVLVAHDVVEAFLPHPIPETTRVEQRNLYLAGPGEDPDAAAKALGTTPAPEEAGAAVAAFGGLGILLMVARRGR